MIYANSHKGICHLKLSIVNCVLGPEICRRTYKIFNRVVAAAEVKVAEEGGILQLMVAGIGSLAANSSVIQLQPLIYLI